MNSALEVGAYMSSSGTEALHLPSSSNAGRRRASRSVAGSLQPMLFLLSYRPFGKNALKDLSATGKSYVSMLPETS